MAAEGPGRTSYANPSRRASALASANLDFIKPALFPLEIRPLGHTLPFQGIAGLQLVLPLKFLSPPVQRAVFAGRQHGVAGLESPPVTTPPGRAHTLRGDVPDSVVVVIFNLVGMTLQHSFHTVALQNLPQCTVVIYHHVVHGPGFGVAADLAGVAKRRDVHDTNGGHPRMGTQIKPKPFQLFFSNPAYIAGTVFGLYLMDGVQYYKNASHCD